MRDARYKWFALSATSLGALMSVMSGSMLLIALPSIVRDLSTSMELVVWVIMSYMLVINVLVPAIGRVADMIGRKRLYVGGFYGWTIPLVLGGFFGAAIMLAFFARVEIGIAEPLFDLRLFKTRVLAFAYASNLLNGIARGALTFLLIFYLQGVRGMDPLTAGIFLTPFALAMMLSAPVSGYLSDKHGSRVLSTVGLGLSAIGLLGFTWIRADTSLAEIVIWQVLMGTGSGIFNSPNTNTIMGSVPVERRGIAAGTRTMMNNTGSVVSIAMTFGVLSSGMTPKAMAALFAGIQVGSEGIFLGIFLRDLHAAFMACFVISVAATIIAYLRGPTPLWGKGAANAG
jgi:MFS family permease